MQPKSTGTASAVRPFFPLDLLRRRYFFAPTLFAGATIFIAVITLKRIYEVPQPADGCRILVDRIWPRGVSKERAEIAVWLKEIGPSTALRKWFGHDPKRWPEFQKRYREELRGKSELTARIRQLEHEHRIVTLVFSARDEERNQAIVLRDLLARRRPKRERRRAAKRVRG
ncbi:MAG: hypothetical protein DMG30_15435 [Acidobacteria bacterium]|nr:MAG: hypothetical protein DMG30_15435 [Acidobacteriota bacterium]